MLVKKAQQKNTGCLCHPGAQLHSHSVNHGPGESSRKKTHTKPTQPQCFHSQTLTGCELTKCFEKPGITPVRGAV